MPLQYQASKFVVKLLRILVTCPGSTAAQIAWICWEKDKGRYPLFAGMVLFRMHKRGLVFSRINSRFWEPGSPRPRKQWYVTDKGFDVHEFYERQRQNGNSPYADGTDRTHC